MAQILIVEDDALISMWVEDSLLDAGYSVAVTSNADHAIALLEVDDEIRVVFTDIDMPGSMDGLRLAAVVRDRWPPVHLIIASGQHRPSVSDMPSDAIFLAKPYLQADVLAAVQSFH